MKSTYKMIILFAIALLTHFPKLAEAGDYLDYPKLFILQTIGNKSERSSHLQNFAFQELTQVHGIPKYFIKKKHATTCQDQDKSTLLHLCIDETGEHRIVKVNNKTLFESFRIFRTIKL